MKTLKAQMMPHLPVNPRNPSWSVSRLALRAFSLIEVTMALGILSFALVGIFGLLPVGLQVFGDAIDTTAQTQIVQTITAMAEQADLAAMGGGSGNTPIATKVTTELNTASARASASPVYYYFNDQGEEVLLKDAIYTVGVVYWRPAVSAQQSNLPNNATSSNFATLWIDIYKNRGVMAGSVPSGKAQTFTVHLADFGKRM